MWLCSVKHANEKIPYRTLNSCGSVRHETRAKRQPNETSLSHEHIRAPVPDVTAGERIYYGIEARSCKGERKINITKKNYRYIKEGM
jgi:hypothetical protein